MAKMWRSMTSQKLFGRPIIWSKLCSFRRTGVYKRANKPAFLLETMTGIILSKKSSITKQKQHAYETISHARVQKNLGGVRCCFLLINVFPRGLFGPPQGRIQGFWKGGSYVSRYEDSLCCFDINFLKYPMKMK